jgi:hypothetical protein
LVNAGGKWQSQTQEELRPFFGRTLLLSMLEVISGKDFLDKEKE